MATALSSIWNFFWGDAEKTELLRHLVTNGVPEQQATEAVKICPRVPAPNGGGQQHQRVLLLHSMIHDYKASESHAVQALIRAGGNATRTLEIYNETMRRQKALKEFTAMGIPTNVAKEALEKSNWNKRQARTELESLKKRQMAQAKREYQAHRLVVQKLAASSSQKTKSKVHRATLSSSRRNVKHERHRTRKVSAKKTQATEKIDLGDDDTSSDDNHSLGDSAIDEQEEEEKEEKQNVARGYHSSDDSIQEDTSAIPVAAVASKPKKNPTTAQKNRVFALRKQISVATCQSLVKALRTTTNDVNDLARRAEFRTGAAAEYLQLLYECPALRQLIVQTLEAKAANQA